MEGEIYRGDAKSACVPGLNCYSCPGAAGACPLGALQNALAAGGHRAGWYVLDPALDDSTFCQADGRGKVTILNLRATCCGPCVEELACFDALCREHPDDLTVLAAHSSVVTDDPAAFLEGRDLSIRFAVDTPDDLVWNLVNGSSALPQTIVLSRSGEVIYNEKGSVTPEMLAALYLKAAVG